MKYTVGILTVSDTCFQGLNEDRSGPKLKAFLEEAGAWNVVQVGCVPDEVEKIQSVVRQWVDELQLNLILTTGGTGFAKRDITPEAVSPLFDRSAPGISTAMMVSSLKITHMAMLSRATAGVRKESVIVTLPGSPKAAIENLEAIVRGLPHALDLASGGSGKSVHQKMQGDSFSHTHSHQSSHHHSCGRDHTHGHSHGHKHGGKGPKPVAFRDRSSPYPMKPVDQAIQTILDNVQTLPTVKVPVDTSLIGYTLAEDIFAKESVPGYRASIVDGYAVVATDGAGKFPVIQDASTAGGLEAPIQLTSGHIARVTTGAPVPEGATGVVMVEYTSLIQASEDGSVEQVVEISEGVPEGANIREIGVDTRAGDLVLKKGDSITLVGGEIGILASVGVREVLVYKRPVVGILSTGNEVIDLTSTNELKYGQIRDSNRPTLAAAIRSAGCEVLDLGIVKDSRETLKNALVDGLDKVDVIISTGGVSMGELDLMKSIIEDDLKAQLHFGRVNMKPGKPTTFATYTPENSEQKKLIFALPGNPVSATVTFYLFVLPSLRKLLGYSRPQLPTLKVKISHSLRLDTRPEYHRAIIVPTLVGNEMTLVASSTGVQQSSRMLSMRSANALLMLPSSDDGKTVLEEGSFVNAILVGSL
ncbi:hypothetical protein K493DRAFT_311686 [Basidiobolus meristosporus CBS 931.73]|uniref:MoaB/Mog domain-containing protein n=1 Tax=Basidiobolus meristosporus CBS 931.73 TaxID=1314790 RepID=A0A1Y1YZR9_9FUNG|nr:hypothetical protein K493DRAFT_311686 [Basidiobolus meristosporus CBS 931.73]|eukprot:ORY03538.1 hypothetical protein K493DRAFT_311686 [Basidiobolus meristosporus CBS 931.73]